MRYVVDSFAAVGVFTVSLVCLFLLGWYVGVRLKRAGARREIIRDIGSAGSSGVRGRRRDPLGPGRPESDHGDGGD